MIFLIFVHIQLQYIFSNNSKSGFFFMQPHAVRLFFEKLMLRLWTPTIAISASWFVANILFFEVTNILFLVTCKSGLVMASYPGGLGRDEARLRT
jgi:hypothetical protein